MIHQFGWPEKIQIVDEAGAAHRALQGGGIRRKIALTVGNGESGGDSR